MHGMASEKAQDANLAVSWKGLTVWSEESRPWYRRRGPAKRTYILKDVSGEVCAGSFTAVIGPSGAGKTTLLACLAGRCRLPGASAAVVSVASVAAVELVPQHDVYIGTITVIEHLRFMAEMRLGKRLPAHQSTKWHRINAIVRQLQLEDSLDTTIASLSGGEKKLVSLATSLLSDPSIILCDEPTTGLDSHSAAVVIGVLKELSTTGCTVVCSIHQPSSYVFHEFQNVILLAEARVLFQGSLEDCKKLFESVKLTCPKTYNPAEFYIKQVSRHERDTAENYIETIHKGFTEFQLTKTFQDRPRIYETNYEVNLYRPNWFAQVGLLVWRVSLSVKREIPMHLLQVFLHLVSAVILCAVYGGAAGTGGDGQRSVQDTRGLLWLITSEVSFGLTYASLAAFGFDLTLYKREVDFYSGSAYYVATFMCMLPRCVIWPFLFLLISTCGVSLPSYLATVGELTIALTLLAFTSAAYGVGMAALLTTTGVIVDIIPCVDLLLFLASGTFLRLSSMPLWSRPLRYLSHFYYGLESVSNIYWQRIDNIECANSTSSMTCLKNGAQVLAEDGYSVDYVLQDTVGLLCLTAAWCLVGYWGLKREGNKGYAY